MSNKWWVDKLTPQRFTFADPDVQARLAYAAQGRTTICLVPDEGNCKDGQWHCQCWYDNGKCHICGDNVYDLGYRANLYRNMRGDNHG